jgi:hypothetical protein
MKMARFRARIRRLRKSLWKLAEQEAMAGLTVTMLYGHLKRLPPDYVGERHSVITKHLGIRNGQEWVEYEEVPGPDPERDCARRNESEFPTPEHRIFRVQFVEPYPRPSQEERQGQHSGITPQSDQDGD